jgi:hypothetical protein
MAGIFAPLASMTFIAGSLMRMTDNGRENGKQTAAARSTPL